MPVFFHLYFADLAVLPCVGDLVDCRLVASWLEVCLVAQRACLLTRAAWQLRCGAIDEATVVPRILAAHICCFGALRSLPLASPGEEVEKRRLQESRCTTQVEWLWFIKREGGSRVTLKNQSALQCCAGTKLATFHFFLPGLPVIPSKCLGITKCHC
jgi:hypothetical protein